MRSHPYTPPPPLPPLLTELTSYLPHRDRDRRAGAAEVALSDLDPETSRLLPPRRRQLRVRVQGRLAPVRSVSVVNPRSAYASTSDHHRVGGPPPRDDAVGCSIPRARARRRYSEDDGRSEDGDGDVGEDGEGDGDGDGDGGDEEKDTQLRGSAYGCDRDVVEDVIAFVVGPVFGLWEYDAVRIGDG
ncbi:hypothetical protein GGR54DRAFT_636705 [Hypoxylon sp. NC1633]|nr:hypothetical protein GGR54DRAFT_636705 [Hypoxylon sp. NC1633]